MNLRVGAAAFAVGLALASPYAEAGADAGADAVEPDSAASSAAEQSAPAAPKAGATRGRAERPAAEVSRSADRPRPAASETPEGTHADTAQRSAPSRAVSRTRIRVPSAAQVTAPVAVPDVPTPAVPVRNLPDAMQLAPSAPAAPVAEAVPAAQVTGSLNAAVVGFFESVSRLLSGLPVAPISDLIAGALQLVRRALFNQLPSASPAQLSSTVAGRVSGSIGATDPEGDALTYTVVSAPALGTVEVGADGGYVYVAGSEYAGSDSFRIAVSDAGFNLLDPFSSRATEVTVAVATPSRPAPVIVAQPDDQGNALISLLGAATRSIDIVIYQINDPRIADNLLNRMAVGVNVRLVLDAFDKSNFTVNSRFVESLRDSMVSQGIASDKLQAHWASENFSITHQKSVIIDAVDATGRPLSPDGLPDSARVLISSGNFADDTFGPFWGSRNFYVTLADPAVVAEVARVFYSDFNCDGRSVTNELGESSILVWSNGSTNVFIDDKGLYPKSGIYYPPRFPGDSADNLSMIQRDEGNVVAYQVGLIEQARAGDLLRVYTLEFVSTDKTGITRALERAAGRGVDVRLVTTYEDDNQKKKANLSALAKAGGTITYFAPQEKVPDALYIHAKAMLLSNPEGEFVAGFVGSQNFSDPSMQYNRELGIPLTPAYADVAAKIAESFDADFAFKGSYAPDLPYTAQLTKDNPSTVPATWLGSTPYPPSEAYTRPPCGCVAEASAQV